MTIPMSSSGAGADREAAGAAIHRTSDGVVIVAGLRVLTNDLKLGTVARLAYLEAYGPEADRGWYVVILDGGGRTDCNGWRMTTRGASPAPARTASGLEAEAVRLGDAMRGGVAVAAAIVAAGAAADAREASRQEARRAELAASADSRQAAGSYEELQAEAIAAGPQDSPEDFGADDAAWRMAPAWTGTAAAAEAVRQARLSARRTRDAARRAAAAEAGHSGGPLTVEAAHEARLQAESELEARRAADRAAHVPSAEELAGAARVLGGRLTTAELAGAYARSAAGAAAEHAAELQAARLAAAGLEAAAAALAADPACTWHVAALAAWSAVRAAELEAAEARLDSILRGPSGAYLDAAGQSSPAAVAAWTEWENAAGAARDAAAALAAASIDDSAAGAAVEA
jgi:hypothetical protein